MVFKVHHRKYVRQESRKEPRDWGGNSSAGHSQAVGLGVEARMLAGREADISEVC